MPRVHRLQHVERFGAADFAYHDSIWTHPEAIAHQVSLGNLTATLDIDLAGLESNDVRLLQLQFSGVFDRDDPFALRNKCRHRIEQGGFSGAGCSGEHYDLVGFNGFKNLLASLNYWQLGRVIEFERVHLLNANLPGLLVAVVPKNLNVTDPGTAGIVREVVFLQ